MNRLGIVSIIALTLGTGSYLQAHEFVGATGRTGATTTASGGHRAACIESRAATDLDINNVRARLRAGGDMWWDGNTTARYVVPNVDPASGKPEISSLFAGAIWLGAYDDGGNLILAAQTYRSSGNDFWNGPLNPSDGTIEKADCEKWDRHFECSGADIDALRADFLAIDPNTGEPDLDVENATLTKGLKGWPGRGNPYFAEIYGFGLPDQDLAPFVDYNGDGVYNPKEGDHPVIEVSGCNADYNNPVYADQMIWWVYNDNGNIHTQTNGQPMIMEVQVTAFGYRTTDAINNMTFYRYKLLNRNALTLKDTYFSLWSDPDLGCSSDDMIGCDTITGMGYVYNGDNDDNATCGANGAVGYGDDKIPALGVDYFRGPLDSAGNQIGLSSFQYHVNDNSPRGDPNSALGYYRLISGSWPDNTPITFGGTGYNPGGGGAETNYVFPSWPDEEASGSWSMCFNGTSGSADFRFLHTSGPFVLKSGATNEMISGVVWVPELPDYPCPSMKQLVEADELAQNLFDDCFKITDGPDAPYIDIVEMENELVLNLHYIFGQNNFGLDYLESPAKLRDFEDSSYRFQGYKIYQVNDPNTSVTELDNPEKSRLIYQCDIQDTVAKIVNWSVFPDEDVQAFIPTVMVDGENKGLKHTFRITQDKFADNALGKLVNHKPYYFCAVAYGYNQYLKYDPTSNSGQADAYLQGRRNFRIYTGIPRNNSPEYYGAVLNAEYGDRPEITRIDGKGNGGGLFLDVADRQAFEEDMFADGKVGRITYVETGGPVDIKITDPLRVAPGTYRLYISDESFVWDRQLVGGSTVYTPMPPTGVTALGDSIYWALIDANDPTQFWSSYLTLDVKNEQYITDLGIALTVRQASTPGTDGTSGFIGSSVEYTDQSRKNWYRAIEDQSSGLFNVLKTGNSQLDAFLDPEQTYSTSEDGWYPFMLCDCRYNGEEYFFTPSEVGGTYCNSWRDFNPTKILSRQRNVNIVMTPDKDKWSRCPVVETATPFHSQSLGLTIPSGRAMLTWKKNYQSVDKDGNEDGSGVGYSWFPGYAYDVETGERLNVFFGENSFFNGGFFPESQVPGGSTGDDMLYNPTNVGNLTPDEFVNFLDPAQSYLSSVYGGHHYIYVANSVYNEGRTIVRFLDTIPAPNGYTRPFPLITSNQIIWSSMGYLNEGWYMDGAKGNIPPSEVVFKLRVETPYAIYNATAENNHYPLYEFSLDKFVPTKESDTTATTALDLINVVPNPYYAYSDYEVTEVDNVIKFVNLPPRCDIKIYSIDGRFVRQYSVAQDYNNTAKNGIVRMGLSGSSEIENQILTSVEWNLKNQANVPVGSGIYLVHVIAKDINGNPIGERVLKSFVINRSFDPQKL